MVLLRRERQEGTKPVVEEHHCGITSCSPQQASASQRLEAIRGHWGIESRLFYVRDVTLGEDASRGRTGDSPQVMAALRNTIISMLHHLLDLRPVHLGGFHQRRQPHAPFEALRGSIKEANMSTQLTLSIGRPSVICFIHPTGGAMGIRQPCPKVAVRMLELERHEASGVPISIRGDGDAGREREISRLAETVVHLIRKRATS